MRLDKWLKVSRLIKRRTVANEVADAGRILIEPGSSNCQKLRLVRPGQEDICSEYSESPWFYEVAEIAMILALKDYDACYAALKKTRQVVTVLEAAREDAQLGFWAFNRK